MKQGAESLVTMPGDVCSKWLVSRASRLQGMCLVLVYSCELKEQCSTRKAPVKCGELISFIYIHFVVRRILRKIANSVYVQSEWWLRNKKESVSKCVYYGWLPARRRGFPPLKYWILRCTCTETYEGSGEQGRGGADPRAARGWGWGAQWLHPVDETARLK